MSARSSDEPLPCIVRSKDGTRTRHTLPAWQHRKLHLMAIHAANKQLVELAAGYRPAPDARVRIFTREWRNHFHPGGAAGDPRWLDPILYQAERHHRRGREIFIGPAERASRSALKWHTEATRCLWLDIDDANQIPTVWKFLTTPTGTLPHGRRPRLVVHSGRGAHFYFPLAQPLHSLTVTTPDGRTVDQPLIARWDNGRPEDFADPQTGELLDLDSEACELIERYNKRLAHAIGNAINEHGRQIATVADEAVAKRSQPMRLAGTINGRVGQFARIVLLDATVAGYQLGDLAGDLPDPVEHQETKQLRRLRGTGPVYDGPDPFKRLDLRGVYRMLTGNEITPDGDGRCPNPAHEDRKPSCDIGISLANCWVCSFGGDIYNLIAAVNGGPVGRTMTKPEFRAVKRRAIELFGDLDAQARRNAHGTGAGIPPPGAQPPPRAAAPAAATRAGIPG
jgi:hypothetical protein